MTETKPSAPSVIDVKADSQEALATSQFVHRKILLRLFLGWLFLSLTIGGVVLWLEISRFQQFVHALALKESAALSGESPYDLEQLDGSTYQHLTNLAQQLVKRNFLVVELYDVNKQLKIKDELLHTLLLITVSITVTTFLMYPIILTINRELTKLSTDLLTGNLELMNVMGSAIAERDSDTNSHNYRVTFYALRMGETVGLHHENILNLITGAFLHDVGKIGIRDPILLKSGKLTPQEFEIMKTHVTLGVDILKQSSWLSGACDVAHFHHEKYDGSGYPEGLKGEAIPLNARIFAIVDVFDALTSKRPYKESWTVHDALAELERDSGSHFDPQLLRIFVSIAPALYQEVTGMEESQMIAMVKHCISRHFLTTAIGTKPQSQTP
ncbi:MAG: HD-GYP domain-containing protein [Nitrosomonas sp.]|uniref:HD-GYP domain-containing protein n=1 Tax=Nitrosomonas sp. TaxID=42353 RepID=UPI0025CE3C1F|nr:HD-GYP domain-containing protein [Nitrosomonas sp.]MBY0473793.1 HD-GYP domain-containing protein [Nitrosomonas sp.]